MDRRLHLRVKPFEALDFLAGLFTNRDIANDDLYSSSGAPTKKAPEAGGPPSRRAGAREPPGSN